MSEAPGLVLGSAMWGWTTDKPTAFQLLDQFYKSGYRKVDGATNYPINKQPADFRRAEQILLEWVKAHGVQDLELIMKVGSVNNMRTPESNLTKSFLLIMLDEYKYAFEGNLSTLMLHWDNREAEEEVQETYEAFQLASEMGYQLGLSGVKFPELHARLNEAFGFDFCIQMKHNLLQSDYTRYAPFHGQKRFITYGVNAGGIKLKVSDYHINSSLKARGGNTADIHPIVAPLQGLLKKVNEKAERPVVSEMNHCGMAYAFHSPDVADILIGPSRVDQLERTIQFHEALRSYDYSDFYEGLKSIASRFN
ncbi:MAG: aldo/keto reductase [Mameliella sp.]|nr:aldo/keto reductase [Phaeodactylibacter sp.]